MPDTLLLPAGEAQDDRDIIRSGSALHDGKNIREARYLKNLHDRLIRMDHLHFPLLVHDLLGGEQHAQPGRGYVLQRLHVDVQYCHAGEGLLDLGLQFRRGGGVQPPGMFSMIFSSKIQFERIDLL